MNVNGGCRRACCPGRADVNRFVGCHGFTLTVVVPGTLLFQRVVTVMMRSDRDQQTRRWRKSGAWSANVKA